MSSKKNKSAQPKIESPSAAKRINTLPDEFNGGRLSTLPLLGITLLMTAIYYGWSFVSDGFYQGEEGAQYINMLEFWKDWKLILGNWPKFGWKLIYAGPALLGQQAVILLNSLFAAFTGFFVYKVCEIKKVKMPITGIIMLITQLLWFQLSHRTYSEILTAFLLILSIYLYYKNQWVASALAFSYIMTIRQEFYIIAVFFGAHLLYKRKWMAIISLSVFPILYNMAGYMATKDCLYLIHSSKQAAEQYKNAYPRQGFDHYFKVSLVIFGSISLAGFVAYIALAATRKIKTDFILLGCALIYFFIHCLFNLQSIVIGTSTGGNWRYMLVISPVMAVLGAIAFDKATEEKKKYYLLFFMVPYLIGVLKFLSFHHNWIKFDEQDPDPFLFFLSFLAALLFILPLRKKTAFLSLIALSAVYMAAMLRPIVLDSENLTQKEVVDWVKENKVTDTHPILCAMPLFNYFFNKLDNEFPKGKAGVGASEINKAAPGTYIFWDTHYATKYGKVEQSRFIRADTFRLVKQWMANDNSMAVVLYEKIK